MPARASFCLARGSGGPEIVHLLLKIPQEIVEFVRGLQCELPLPLSRDLFAFPRNLLRMRPHVPHESISCVVWCVGLRCDLENVREAGWHRHRPEPDGQNDCPASRQPGAERDLKFTPTPLGTDG